MSVGVCEAAIHAFFPSSFVCVCVSSEHLRVCERQQGVMLDVCVLLCVYLRQQFLFVCVCVRGV